MRHQHGHGPARLSQPWEWTVCIRICIRLGVERPEDAFSIAHFEVNPEAFYTLARDLWPSSDILPTATHHFLALLEAKGKLRRAYTQNVDSLEPIAGLSPENGQVHGHFRSVCRVTNGLSVPIEELHAAVLSGSETCASWSPTWRPGLISYSFGSRCHRERSRELATILLRVTCCS